MLCTASQQTDEEKEKEQPLRPLFISTTKGSYSSGGYDYDAKNNNSNNNNNNNNSNSNNKMDGANSSNGNGNNNNNVSNNGSTSRSEATTNEEKKSKKSPPFSTMRNSKQSYAANIFFCLLFQQLFLGFFF